MRITKHVTFKIEWRSIALVIRERRDYLWPGKSHIEVHVVRPKHAVIPTTETWYRSHFIDTEALTAAGGAVTFVINWLEREATSKSWRSRELAAAQGDLFK